MGSTQRSRHARSPPPEWPGPGAEARLNAQSIPGAGRPEAQMFTKCRASWTGRQGWGARVQGLPDPGGVIQRRGEGPSRVHSGPASWSQSTFYTTAEQGVDPHFTEQETEAHRGKKACPLQSEGWERKAGPEVHPSTPKTPGFVGSAAPTHGLPLTRLLLTDPTPTLTTQTLASSSPLLCPGAPPPLPPAQTAQARPPYLDTLLPAPVLSRRRGPGRQGSGCSCHQFTSESPSPC